MNVVEKINLILKQANISKVNLAKYLGVSRQMVYNYLDGEDLSKLPNEKCQLLLKLLGVKTEKDIDKPPVRRNQYGRFFSGSHQPIPRASIYPTNGK